LEKILLLTPLVIGDDYHNKRFKAMELENSLLMMLLAERDLDIEVLKGIKSKKWLARCSSVSI
jgi:hypothetical protein